MNWQSIIETLIRNLSWPLTILILCLLFKDKFSKIINFKVKNYEISFDNEFKSIKKDIKTKNFNKNQWNVTSTKSLKGNMIDLAEKSPVAVVLQAWGIMDQIVIECAENKGFKYANNPAAAIQYLFDNECLVIGYVNIYFRLFALKERFTNYENEVVTKERALEAADTILDIADNIKQFVLHSNGDKNN